MAIEEFTKLTSQIYIREADVQAADDHPEVILIFGWGDASLRHVSKYSDGYRALYPGSRHVVILSSISSTLSSTLEKRSTAMRPLIDFGGKRTLVHAMSNTGAISYGALLNVHRRTTGKPFPHELLVLDSTPGTPYLSLDTLKRWSWAMTINTAKFFPWPSFLTRAIWIVFLCLNRLMEKILRRQSAAEFAGQAVNDPELEFGARKLFLYGNGDNLISYKDVEEYASQSREKGYGTDLVEFEASGHVEHMRKHSELYWKSIQDSWMKTRKI